MYNLGMSDINISAKEFEEHLQTFVNKEITEFYYITDSLVVFKAGRSVTYNQTDKSDVESEFELWIWGGWNYQKNDVVIETSIPVPGENIPALRGRIGDFIESIHPTKVTSIALSADGEIAEVELDNQGKFIVQKQNDCFLNFSHEVLDEQGNYLKTIFVETKSVTGELIYREFDPNKRPS